MGHISTLSALEAIADYIEDTIEYVSPVYVHVMTPESVNDTPAIMLELNQETVSFAGQRVGGEIEVDMLVLARRRSNLPDDVSIAYSVKDAVDIVLEGAALQNKNNGCKIFGLFAGMAWTVKPVIFEYARAQYVAWQYNITLKY